MPRVIKPYIQALDSKSSFGTVVRKIKSEIIYPESDGKRMADNTKQFEWIVKIKEGLEVLFLDKPKVFIAGDLLWYPVEGNNKLRAAPDAMVVFGRLKGHRGSYLQWKEKNIPPQVVFEVLSPGNRKAEMTKKFKFYEQYGVEEYYIYDPDKIKIKGFKRINNRLEPVKNMQGFISPRLKIHFEIEDNDLNIYRPDGRKFLFFTEVELKLKEEQIRVKEADTRAEEEKARAEKEKARAEEEKARAEKEKARAEKEKARAEKEKARAEMLEAKLKELGIQL
ncbi:MAG: Uma2 family endonuclease [Desulfobacterales bacterium]|nr:Uma2 family endonuclease [Desulfobacterales bacterium]